MDESSSFTSLMAMVESHLSKTSVSAVSEADGEADEARQAAAAPSFSLPNICSVRHSDSEQSLLPPPQHLMQLPRIPLKDNEITEILAHQMKNMLVAREKKEDYDRRILADEPKGARPKSASDDYVIDLSASIIKTGATSLPSQRVEPVLSAPSSSSSMESLADKKCTEEEKEVLPMCDNLSYLMKARVRRGVCSPCGRVLAARLRAVAAPYLHRSQRYASVIPFDFSSPSPCDINRQRRLHPHPDLYAHMNMVDRFMATTRDQC